MDMRSGKSKSYVITSSKQEKKALLIPVELTPHENEHNHFWDTFLAALVKWDLEFTQLNKQKIFPETQEEQACFIDDLKAHTTDNPLALFISNMNHITDPLVQEFISALSSANSHQLVVVQLFSPLEVETEQKTPYGYSGSGKKKYLTFEEERKVYRDNSFVLTPELFDKARSITQGWIPTVNHTLTYFRSEGVPFRPDFEDLLDSWVEEAVEGFSRIVEKKILMYLSCLDKFTLEMVQDLFSLNHENLAHEFNNALVLRLDFDTGSYRFGPRTLVFLRQQQTSLGDEEIHDFFVRVGDWYKERDDRIEAINHYRKAGAHRKILQIMSQWTFPASGELSHCYVEAIHDMPKDFIKENPLTVVILGHSLSSLYRYHEAARVLSEFCEERDRGTPITPEMRSVVGEAYLCWANAAITSATESEKIIYLFRKASLYLTNGSLMYQTKYGFAADVPVLMLRSKEAKQLQQSVELFETLEPIMMESTPDQFVGMATLCKAELAYYQREFKDTEQYAHEVIEAALKYEQYDMACRSYFLLMKMFMAKGNYDKTIENLELLKVCVQNMPKDTIYSLPDIAESWLNLSLGRDYLMADWIVHDSQAAELIAPWNYGTNRVLKALHLLVNEQYNEVLQYADCTIEVFKKRAYNLLNITFYGIKAFAYHELGDKKKSVESMQEVYEWSIGCDLKMPLIELNRFVRPIIENCRRDEECTIPLDWLDEMDKKAASYYVYLYNVRKRHDEKERVETSILENLSGAEKRLLLSIAEGLTAKEIAEIQGRTVSTIKGMSRRLYAKIGAKNKADAIRIASEFDIEALVTF